MNAALNKPITTTLANSFSRDISVVNDGTTNETVDSDAYSSTSTSGVVSIDFQARYFITRVRIFWSGWWGANTNGFAVQLRDGSANAVTVYQTTTAPQIHARVDDLDLSGLSTATDATEITLMCNQRAGNGYAILELEAYGQLA